MRLPAGLTAQEQAFPTVFVDCSGLESAKPESRDRVNRALEEALARVHPGAFFGQVLLKVHIGEPKCVTRLQPRFAASSARSLRERGAAGVVAGDTTVAYSGPRGHKQNPADDVSAYLDLASKHGWSAEGPARVPFVVLDRPATAIAGQFEFSEEEERVEIPGIRRFKNFYLAGGFAAADFVINHAHLTLHGVAGLAGCVKAIAMGCSSLPGKLRLHQSLLPQIDAEKCVACGRCVDSCPEGALAAQEGSESPVVDPDLCIGCGECAGVCALGTGALKLRGSKITEWQRGQDTLPGRMADYALGLMHGRWDRTIHVLHMYRVTKLCDCVNVRQSPILSRDLGFLVGKNPFAMDRVAGRMLAEALARENRDLDESALSAAETTAAYAADAYGVLADTHLERMSV